jgi:flagellar protein FliS
MMNNPYESYKRMQVETASPGRLLLLLYEGALKNLRLAKAGIEQKNISQAHNSLIKAQNIVLQLNEDLNMEAGGEIAQNLRNLYLFIYQRMIDANVQKNAAMVQEAIDLLSKLKEGWDGVILKTKSTATP